MNIPVPILPSKYDWKVGHCMENKHKTLQAVEKKEDQPGALGTEGWHGGKIPGFSFCLVHSHLDLKNLVNLRTPVVSDKTSSDKSSLFSGQRTRKGASEEDRKLWDNNLFTLVINCIKEKPWPQSHFAGRGQVGQPRHSPTEWYHRMPSREPRFLSLVMRCDSL